MTQKLFVQTSDKSPCEQNEILQKNLQHGLLGVKFLRAVRFPYMAF